MSADVTIRDVHQAMTTVTIFDDMEGSHVVVRLLMTDGGTVLLAAPTLDDLTGWWHDVARGIQLARKAGLQ